MVIGLALIWIGAMAMASDRIALVIGNGAYDGVADLKNPLNDARAVAEELTALGFTVTHIEDASRNDMIDALRTFRNESFGKRQALVYYAGHGIEIDKQNYLVPTDALLKSDIDVEYEAVSMDLVVGATSGASGLRLVVLDACRDNPFLQTMQRSAATRSIGRGLAIVEPAGNTLVAYSAKGGTVASDGKGDYSPYAAAFLKALRTPGLEIGKFFRQIRDDVVISTAARQEPFLYGSLSARDIYLSPAVLEVEEPEPETPAAPAAANGRLALELAFWQSAEAGGSAADYQDYLEQFPDGTFRSMAERRLAGLAGGERAAAPAPAARSEQSEPEPVEVVAPAVPAPEPEAPLTTDEIRDLQARLRALGLNPGPADGQLGPRTVQAIRAFEASAELEVDGVPDRALLDTLRRVVSDEFLASRPTPQTAAAAPASRNHVTGIDGKWCLCGSWFTLRSEPGRVHIENALGMSYSEEIVITGPNTWTSNGVGITRVDANTIRADRALCPVMRRCD
ncbi:MAG: caspase family protein [Pseudomonadota bacterium]